MVVVFYVSGHGLGHATRDLEVAAAVARRQPRARIVVRSSAPAWAFESAAKLPIERQAAEVDTGVAQLDSLRIDEDQTARRAASFYAGFRERVDQEAAVLRGLNASLVVGDIPPLAHAAAARAGVASVAVGNFTWDWIYEAYGTFDSLAPGVLDVVRDAYAKATLALRLPLNGGFKPMAGVVRDVPLIARHARHPREVTRPALGIGPEAIVALVSFGRYGLDLPYAAITRTGRLTLLVTRQGSDADADDDGRAFGGMVHCANLSALASRGVHYPDLVAAADVVVSKPGYGIVSECIANGAALLYASRDRFPEHDVLVEAMPPLLRCRHISQEDLSAGNWEAGIAALLRQPEPAQRTATNGADVVAEAALALAADH